MPQITELVIKKEDDLLKETDPKQLTPMNKAVPAQASGNVAIAGPGYETGQSTSTSQATRAPVKIEKAKPVQTLETPANVRALGQLEQQRRWRNNNYQANRRNRRRRRNRRGVTVNNYNNGRRTDGRDLEMVIGTLLSISVVPVILLPGIVTLCNYNGTYF